MMVCPEGSITVTGRGLNPEDLLLLPPPKVRATAGQLSAVMRPFLRRAAYEQFRHFIRPLAQTYVDGRREGRDVLFYDAPAALIFHHSPYADTAADAIACTYAILAAESLGLGNTVIGGAPPILQRNKRLCGRLGIPTCNTPSISLIVGYPATHFERCVRRRFSQLNTIS
jgi:hypothetical protein